MHVFSRVTRHVSVLTVMDKSSLHVQGGLVNEAAVYDVTHHADHAQMMTVGSRFQKSV